MSTDVRSPVNIAIAPQANAVLPDDPVILKRMILELLDTLRATRQDYEQVRHRLDQLLRKMYGSKAEKFDPNQPFLFADLAPGENEQQEPTPPAVETPPPEDPSITPKKNPGHGRKPLPKDLKRERRVHDVPETERLCPCCQKQRVKIGEEITEQLDYVPASLYVIEHVRIKYACQHCAAQALPAQIVIGPKPDLLFAKGLPGPGLVAQVLVCKYTDHLPLHRQERIHLRAGVAIARQTMWDWMAASAELLRPLYDMMASRVLRSRVLHTDDTTLPVQDRTRETIRKGSLWVYLGDRDFPHNVFDYTASRARDGPKDFLGAFAGYLQADAFSGYDGIYANGKVLEVACWAHARRKFYDVRTSAAALSHEALARIGQLYAVEKEATLDIAERDLDGAEADALRLRLRQEQAVPALASLRAWLDQQQTEALPKSPVALAINYTLNQWDALVRYTTSGILAIDNNVAERALRAIAIGRKNWLFTGSDNGGRVAAILFSMTSSCGRHGLDPFAYLRDVLSRLAKGPLSEQQLEALLPNHWATSAISAPSQVP
jgi:transposase